MRHSKKTDHFLLAKGDPTSSRGASTLELAALVLAVIAVVATGALLI